MTVGLFSVDGAPSDSALSLCVVALTFTACGDDSGAADASTSRDASSSRDASATPDGGTRSADAPIFISGPAGGEVAIDGHLDVEGSYLLLAHLTLDGDDAGLRVRTPSDHIAVRLCEVRNAVGRGSGLYTGRWNPEDDPATATQIVFYGNSLHDLGNWRATTDEDHHCASLGHQADHVWFVDNQMSRFSGDGVQVNAKKAYLAETLHHVYIGRNQAWENKQTGFWTKQATDVVMSQNRVWAMRPSGSSGTSPERHANEARPPTSAPSSADPTARAGRSRGLGGGLSRVRITHVGGALTAGGLHATSDVGQRVRWDLTLLEPRRRHCARSSRH